MLIRGKCYCSLAKRLRTGIRIRFHAFSGLIFKFIHVLYVNGSALLSGNFLVSNSDTSDLRIDGFLWTSCGFCRFVPERNDGRMTRVHVKVLVYIFQSSIGRLGVQKVDNGDKE